jgi:hypothetical protein
LAFDRKADEMTRRTLRNLFGIIVGLILLVINPEKIVLMVKGGRMYYFRVWVGSIVLALGVAGIVWFIRNLVRGRTRRALGFSKHPFLYVAIIIIFVIGGLWIYSGFETIPLIPVLGGIIIGWFFLNKIMG